MSLDTLLSIIRTAMTLAGSYVLGHNLLGHTIDASLWQEIMGAAMAVGGTIWGICDKPATIEGLQSAIRSIVLAVGGVLMALGVVNQQNLDTVLALLLAVIPMIQSHTSKVKVKQLDSGKLTTDAGGKVLPAAPQVK